MRALVCLLLGLMFPPATWAGELNMLLADASSQLVQNTRAESDNLSAMRDARMIRRFARKDYLVPVAVSTRSYYLHGIRPAYHYCRPWTKLFLDRLSRQYYARFKQPLRVTSLVRTVASQTKLAGQNSNAANAFGPLRSSHLTGATLDISKRSMSPEAQHWMRDVLYRLRKQGYLYAIEEFEQPTFHIMVYRNYPHYVRRITRPARTYAEKLARNRRAGSEHGAAQ
jgi:hypothetical protein